MVDQRVAAEKQNGVGTPYIPPMTRRMKCRIDPEQSPYTCVLPEHKPVRRGREMIDRAGSAAGGTSTATSTPARHPPRIAGPRNGRAHGKSGAAASLRLFAPDSDRSGCRSD